MLVLTRRTNERIIIGQDIIITVLKVQNDQVRIGIEAPRNVEVHREEVYKALLAANQAATINEAQVLEQLRGVTPSADAQSEGGPNQQLASWVAPATRSSNDVAVPPEDTDPETLSDP
jgi:carbon storage regulator